MPPSAISLRQLRAFAAIARLGSLRRAAAELNVSQPALSQGLRLLEQEVGCRLLTRDARGAAPTDAGRLLLSTCESILQSLDFTVGSLRERGDKERRLLRVAALPSIARQVVVPAYRRLCAAGGTAELFIRDAVADEVVRMVIAGEVDFALAPAPQAAPALIAQPLLRSPLRVVVAQGHPLSNGATWRELAEERFIFVARASATYELVTSAFRAAGCFPRHYSETHTAETAATMAAEGMGVTVLHARNIDEIAHYGFAHGPVTDPDRALTVALIRRAGQPLLSAAGAFWAYLIEQEQISTLVERPHGG